MKNMQNSFYIIKKPNGEFIPLTCGYFAGQVRLHAPEKCMNTREYNLFKNDKERWQALYKIGYRCVKVKLREVLC